VATFAIQPATVNCWPENSRFTGFAEIPARNANPSRELTRVVPVTQFRSLPSDAWEAGRTLKKKPAEETKNVKRWQIIDSFAVRNSEPTTIRETLSGWE